MLCKVAPELLALWGVGLCCWKNQYFSSSSLQKVVQKFIQCTFLDLLCLKRMHSCCTDSNTTYFNFNIVCNSIMYISLGLSLSQSIQIFL